MMVDSDFIEEGTPLSVLTSSRLDKSGFKDDDDVRLSLIDEMWDVLNRDDHFLCLDTEFTGGHGLTNRLIELGICESNRSGSVVGGMSFRCNPHRRSEGQAQRVHGISDVELRGCKEFRHYSKELLEYIKGRVLIVHDATSDIVLLNDEFARISDNPIKVQEICTVVDSVQLARLNPYSGKNSQLMHLLIITGCREDADIIAPMMMLISFAE